VRGRFRAHRAGRSGRDVLTVVLFVLLGAALLCAVTLGAVRLLSSDPTVDTGVPFDVTPSSAVSEEATTERYERPETVKSYNILCLGTDVATGLSDTIIIVNVSSGGQINGVQIPRDTYVEYDGRATKMNACIANLGIDGAIDVLEKALCIQIDFYVRVNTTAFAKAVDAIGGVEITIEKDMDYDDPYQDLHIHLKAGRQTLDGNQAQQFVRYRSGYANGDLGRLDAQKTFLVEAMKQMKAKINVESAAKMVLDVFPDVYTDMTIADSIGFFRLILENRETAKLTMLTAPGQALWTEKTGTSYYVLGRKALLETVNTYLNVYTTAVSDEIFDRERIFVLDGDDDFERIYTYSILTPKPVSEN